jgi:transcription initiation factor TFIIIB Brf1 subunit/transcription initiation factor TFIIB
LNEIIDEREGTYICTDCGLVLNALVYNEYHPVEKMVDDENKQQVKEILERLHLPECFLNTILDNFNNRQKHTKKTLMFSIYQTLNELNFPISIKEISAVSGLSDVQIYDVQAENETILLKPDDLLEKYCKMLNFDYKVYSLIKGSLPSDSKTGHNPLTIIGTAIYVYCKRNKVKYSMKHIANVCNISCVSIQRYLKYCKNKK